ncbi:MAG: hypothetical protein JWP09_816 [Candidatus Taylorbacteria bacterium]|nr:hypothetical protein [Candidatus Taylorbacteria bacterium]
MDKYTREGEVGVRGRKLGHKCRKVRRFVVNMGKEYKGAREKTRAQSYREELETYSFLYILWSQVTKYNSSLRLNSTKYLRPRLIMAKPYIPARTKRKKEPQGSFLKYRFVRERRLELPYPYGRYHLKVVRLPISPPAH